MCLTPAIVRNGVGRHQLDRFSKIFQGIFSAPQRHVGIATIVVGGAITGCQFNGTGEIKHRLLRLSQFQERITPIVVDNRVIGEELDRLIEVGNRLLGLLQPPFSNTAVVENIGTAHIGKLAIFQRRVERGNCGLIFTTQEICRPLTRAQYGILRRRRSGRRNGHQQTN